MPQSDQHVPVDRPGDFDAAALCATMDAQRLARGLSWTSAAKQMSDMSAELNARDGAHPISPSTLTAVVDATALLWSRRASQGHRLGSDATGRDD